MSNFCSKMKQFILMAFLVPGSFWHFLLFFFLTNFSLIFYNFVDSNLKQHLNILNSREVSNINKMTQYFFDNLRILLIFKFQNKLILRFISFLNFQLLIQIFIFLNKRSILLLKTTKLGWIWWLLILLALQDVWRLR